MQNTEHDYLQQVKEYKRQKLRVWDMLLVAALVVALAMLVLALAQVGASERSDAITIEATRVPSITLADSYPQRWLEPPTLTGHSVILTVRHRGIAPCVLPPPRLIRQAGGTYELQESTVVFAIACWSDTSWKEEWSALPEVGGVFMRKLFEKE